jgi:hypothetical protein
VFNVSFAVGEDEDLRLATQRIGVEGGKSSKCLARPVATASPRDRADTPRFGRIM